MNFPSKRLEKAVILTCVIACTVFFGLSASAYGSITTAKWTLKRKCSGMETVSTSVTAKSAIHCAVQCSKLANCTHFSYVVTTSTCHFGVKDCTTASLLTLAKREGGNLTDVICVDLCPAELGYSEEQGKCVKLHVQQKNYTEARSACEKEGGHLFHFKDLNKDSAIVTKLKTAHGITSDKMWVGADDMVVEGQFRYSDGCPLALNSGLWNTAEPNNMVETEDCVELSTFNYRFNDNECKYEWNFLCEMN